MREVSCRRQTICGYQIYNQLGRGYSRETSVGATAPETATSATSSERGLPGKSIQRLQSCHSEQCTEKAGTFIDIRLACPAFHRLVRVRSFPILETRRPICLCMMRRNGTKAVVYAVRHRHSHISGLTGSKPPVQNRLASDKPLASDRLAFEDRMEARRDSLTDGKLPFNEPPRMTAKSALATCRVARYRPRGRGSTTQSSGRWRGRSGGGGCWTRSCAGRSRSWLGASASSSSTD